MQCSNPPFPYLPLCHYLLCCLHYVEKSCDSTFAHGLVRCHQTNVYRKHSPMPPSNLHQWVHPWFMLRLCYSSIGQISIAGDVLALCSVVNCHSLHSYRRAHFPHIRRSKCSILDILLACRTSWCLVVDIHTPRCQWRDVSDAMPTPDGDCRSIKGSSHVFCFFLFLSFMSRNSQTDN